VAAPRPTPAYEEVEEAAEDGTQEPELVPLDEAEEESVGAVKAIPGEDDEDLEIEENLGGDEKLLELDEEPDEGVADLIEGDEDEI
jgi:hypothetical protein